MAAYFDPLKQNRILDLRETVDAAARANDAPVKLASGDDGSRADDAVEGPAHPSLLAATAKDELGRGEIGLKGADRPLVVVHVEQRIDANEVHIGLEVGVERADVPPVGVALAVLVTEGKGEHAVRADRGRNDVAAEIAPRARNVRITAQLFEQ